MLDSKTIERLIEAGSGAIYAPPGDLLYRDQTTLIARPFDTGKLRFTGPAVPIAQSVGNINSSMGFFSVSQTDVLTYSWATAIPNTIGQMTVFNRSGEKLGTVGQPDVNSTPALSPDGTRLAVAAGNTPSKRYPVVYDSKRGTASRLTFDPANDINPVWSLDGSRILFTSARKNNWDIYQKDANGLGQHAASLSTRWSEQGSQRRIAGRPLCHL